MTNTMPTRVKPMFGAAAAVLALSLVASTGAMAQSASFDCRNARTTNEVAICKSPALRVLDREVAQIYADTLPDLEEPTQSDTVSDQRIWLAARHACGSAERCLFVHYRKRLDALRAVRDSVFTQ
jgi:uncharacterized protein